MERSQQHCERLRLHAAVGYRWLGVPDLAVAANEHLVHFLHCLFAHHNQQLQLLAGTLAATAGSFVSRVDVDAPRL